MAKFVDNSSASGDLYNGKLEHVGTGDDPEGTPWELDSGSSAYPENGTIDLGTHGTGHKRINTQWIAPPDEEWTATGVYNVVFGISFDIYAIHYKGNGYVDIYLGNQDNQFPSTPTFASVAYTPSTLNYFITEGAPSIILASVVEYSMGSFIIK